MPKTQNSVGKMGKGVNPAYPQHKPAKMGNEPLDGPKPVWRGDLSNTTPESGPQAGNYSDSRTHADPSKGRSKMDPGAF